MLPAHALYYNSGPASSLPSSCLTDKIGDLCLFRCQFPECKGKKLFRSYDGLR